MIGTGPNKIYINREPLERILRIPFDAGTELDRVKHSLDWSLNAKPIFNFNVDTPETVARVKDWYDARLAEIAIAKQRYRQRLEQARDSGAINTGDYQKALMDSVSLTSPFERARREADEIYSKEKK